MRCPKCGYVFFEETYECPKCGAELEEDTILFEDEGVEKSEPVFVEEKTKDERKKTKPSTLELPFKEEKPEKKVLIPAPIGLRAGAALIDLIIILSIGVLTTLLPYHLGDGAFSVSQFFVWGIIIFLETILYFSLSHYLMASTIGKAFFEIEISAYKRELSFPLLLLKSILGFILTLPLFLTWIYTLVNEDEIPLHDVILGVLSVEKE